MCSRFFPDTIAVNWLKVSLLGQVVCLSVLLLAGFMFPGVIIANETGDDLLRSGQLKLDDIHEMIRSRENAERSWSEEKIYLGSLIESLRRQREEIDSQLAKLEPLVERKEAEWKRLKEQSERADEIAAILAPVVNDWLARIGELLAQAPQDMRTELGNELELLMHYAPTEKNRQLELRMETMITILDRLNQLQAKTMPVIETWNDRNPKGEIVRVIYLGLGAALYQIIDTSETGWYWYSNHGWERKSISGAESDFLDYWNALESGTPFGIHTFPFPANLK